MREHDEEWKHALNAASLRIGETIGWREEDGSFWWGMVVERDAANFRVKVRDTVLTPPPAAGGET